MAPSPPWPRLLVGGPLFAQHSYTRSEIENGAHLYLGSCATCHGARGDMVRGVALMSGRFQRASTDEELVKIIISGIAGTAMAPNNYTDLEAGLIVAYGTAAGDSVTVTAGDSARGKALFTAKASAPPATPRRPARRRRSPTSACCAGRSSSSSRSSIRARR